MEFGAMFRVLRVVVAAAAAVLSTFATSPALAKDVLVFAAASLKNAGDDVGKAFEATSGITPVFSFASSADLAKQIEHGAPAALFISADDKWMDYLAERQLIVTDTRRELLGNRLVLIAPADSQLTLDLTPGGRLSNVLGDARLALADPDSVPAGRYAKAALETLNLWANIEPMAVRAKDVRAALVLVERGEAAAGVVYLTDALASDKIKIVAEFPRDSHPPIVYPVALIAGHDDDAARAFYRFLLGQEARAIFQEHGFTVIGTSAATN
ncbi:MAG: molybdate ABC transporter substrate-binding protein, partial [Dongiaceae bacterium]